MEIPYQALSLDEAVFLLETMDEEEGFFDATGVAVIRE